VPEGDTIWRTAAALRPRLTGHRVHRAEPAALKRVEGTTVTGVDAIGKHLLVRFDNGLSLHTHMRMTGAWHLYRPGEAWRRPARLARAVIEVEGTVAVLFNAPLVALKRTDREGLTHLGPDLLGDDFEAARVVHRARSLPASVPIGELLLDQRVAAGIGNVYKCETLWWLRLDPWAPQESLTDAQLTEVFAVARDALRSNLGTFERRFPGYGRGAVHGRGGRPCRRCGTPIRVRAQGEQARLTYWCPGCQT
jgi:endonuclease VIII